MKKLGKIWIWFIFVGFLIVGVSVEISEEEDFIGEATTSKAMFERGLLLFGSMLIVVGGLIKLINYNKKERKKKIEEERKRGNEEIVKKRQLRKEAEKEFENNLKEKKGKGRAWVCDKCDYRWESKKSFGEPSVCPHCKEKHITKYSKTEEWEKEQRGRKETFIEDYINEK